MLVSAACCVAHWSNRQEVTAASPPPVTLRERPRSWSPLCRELCEPGSDRGLSPYPEAGAEQCPPLRAAGVVMKAAVGLVRMRLLLPEQAWAGRKRAHICLRGGTCLAWPRKPVPKKGAGMTSGCCAVAGAVAVLPRLPPEGRSHWPIPGPSLLPSPFLNTSLD